MKIIKLSIILFGIVNSNFCFDIVNKLQRQIIETKLISIFNSRNPKTQIYNINPKSTKTITLPFNSIKLKILVLKNAHLIKKFVVDGELLQDLKTSSTARLEINKNNNQIDAKLIR